MTIGLSHGGSNIYTSAGPSTEVLVGTNDGAVLLRRRGEGWEVAHRGLPGLHISSVIAEPVTGTMFAGAFFGSVHASEDGGRTWEERSNGIEYRDVFSLASRQLADGGVRVYAGTEPAHLYQSDDMGRHWTELPALRSVPSVNDWSFPAPPHVAHTKFIRFDPSDPNVIYACIEQGALLKSEDLGETWQEMNTLGFFRDPNRSSAVFYDIHKLLIDPRDTRRLFVTGGAGLYVSADGGGHWERRMAEDWAPDVYPDALVFDPLHPDTMFIGAGQHNPTRWRDGGVPGYSGSRLYRSRDGGVTFEPLSGGLPGRMQEEVGGLCLEAWDGGSQVFAATSAGDVWWSEDEGDRWDRIASGLGGVAKKFHDVLLSSADLSKLIPIMAR